MKVQLLQALACYTNQAGLVSTTVLMTTWQRWHQLILKGTVCKILPMLLYCSVQSTEFSVLTPVDARASFTLEEAVKLCESLTQVKE